MSAAASGGGNCVGASGAGWLLRLPHLITVASLLIAAIALSSSLHAETQGELAWIKADKGRTLLLRGQYETAVGHLTSALQFSGLSDEGRVIALEARGLAHWRLRALRPALDDLNAAVALAPEDAALYNNRGNVLLGLGMLDEALKDFGQAILLSPFFAAAYTNRGNTRFLMGRFSAAIEDFTVAVGLAPDNAASFNGRGKAQLALRRPAGAMRDFSRAIALQASYGQAYANRAEALGALHRYDDAVADYNAAIKLGLTSAQIYAGRGTAYAAMNRPLLAVADFGNAAKLGAPAASLNPASLASFARPQMPDRAQTPLARAALSDPRLPAPLPCDSVRRETAAAEPEAALHQVADASARTMPSSLVYRSTGTADGALGRDEAASSIQLDSPCGPRGGLAIEGNAAPAPGIAAWSVERDGEGDYIASLALARPAIRLVLEMYGDGAPELLHWQTLRGRQGGIGLLHYFGGTSPSGERLEYIAVIDTVSGKLIAIEPCQFGATRASWTWGDGSLTVVDPQGVPSRLQLRVRAARDEVRHVARIKRAHRPLPPRFAHMKKRYDWASRFTHRGSPHRARWQAPYRGYAASGFSLK